MLLIIPEVLEYLSRALDDWSAACALPSSARSGSDGEHGWALMSTSNGQTSVGVIVACLRKLHI